MAEGAGPQESRRRRRAARFAVSRLTVTILLANFFSLVVLLGASFLITAYRDGLVEAKLEGVRGQAQIIAGILAQIAIDEQVCQLDAIYEQGGQRGDGVICTLSLSEVDVNTIFNRIWESFEGRVRIFNAPQTWSDPPVTDPQTLLLEDVVLRRDLIVAEPLAPIDSREPAGYVRAARAWIDEAMGDFLTGGYRRAASRTSLADELNAAMAASPFAEEKGASSVRINEDGELVASVSVPIRHVQAIYGIVTAEIGGIDEVLAESRLAIFPFFGFACIAALISSLMLTAQIAQPIRQLAIASDRVREGISAAARARIPDFTRRRDEIGELSASLRALTQTIYARIEAIESFAADVAHELKNPLTSIRSATETLDLAPNEEARRKLMAVIRKDVARMDRLITDISNASRLDAELARQAREAVDLRRLLADIAESYAATAKDGEARVVFDAAAAPVAWLLGNPGALSRVFRNLIDNARSFSPAGGTVRLFLDTADGREPVARARVEDDGPGIPADALEKIFERFYTKRPAGAAFGDNSGLGLAICRQIVVSHGGRIWAENRAREDGGAARGARFVVELPLEAW